MVKNNPIPGWAFRVRILAFGGGLLGLFLIPYLSIQLNPKPRSHQLNIQFAYPNAGPDLIENEVTSRLESAFARLDHLEEMTSESGEGYGRIQLKFDRYTDIENKRLEIAALIRQLYPSFKKKISFPEISYKSSFNSKQSILTYALISDLDAEALEQWTQRQIIQPLSLMKGINSVELQGLQLQEWQIEVKEEKRKQLNIDYSVIVEALQGLNQQEDIGWTIINGNRNIYLRFGQQLLHANASQTLNSLLIADRQGRSFYLSDLAVIRKLDQPIRNYFRINGRKSVNLLIYPDEGVNQIRLAKNIKKKIQQLVPKNLDHTGLVLQQDRTMFFERELKKIGKRVGLTVAILWVLILLLYPRQLVVVITISLVLSLLWSVITYYFLDLELHTYSIAGLTLSLGIILDNLIIMADHVRHKGNHKILIALLAATLTTTGAFSVVFFLEPEYKEQLNDFIWVFSVNLFISLLAALFLIPALLRKGAPLDMAKLNCSIQKIKRKRRILIFNKIYRKYIFGVKRWRKGFWPLLILCFGIPIFLLPPEIEGNSWWSDAYNQTIGSKRYQNKIRIPLEKYLGGTLRLFVQSKERFHFSYEEPEQTKLFVRAALPYGSTINQLNYVLEDFERFLSQFPEVAKFQTSISAYNNSYIEIAFTEKAEKSAFPYQLKSLLESKAVNAGAGDFSIYGVGIAFNNELRGDQLTTHLRLTGFNYPQLWEIAKKGRKQLLAHMRIQKVQINSKLNWEESQERYYVLDIAEPAFLLQNNLSIAQVGSNIRQLPPQKAELRLVSNEGDLIPLIVKSDDARQNYFWEANQMPIALDSIRFYRNQYFTSVEEFPGAYEIVRHNQAYQLYLEYDFIGNRRLAQKVKEDKIEAIREQLPIGYQIEDRRGRWWEKDSGQKISLMIIVAIFTIFLICAALFNSLRWALVPLCLIPLSYIGIFLGVHALNFRFDQGGFAAFLLVAGLSVNAAIFIINDYLNLRKNCPWLPSIKLYLKAFNGKIVPILLTALSTCLGLLPFVIYDQDQPFWYALALCTILGIVFSVFALFLFLPLFFRFRT